MECRTPFGVSRSETCVFRAVKCHFESVNARDLLLNTQQVYKTNEAEGKQF
jgi:hypothetical protein